MYFDDKSVNMTLDIRYIPNQLAKRFEELLM